MTNFENRTLYHGDNLDFLCEMNSKTVHLIATDPPFNKNRDFHATPESLAKGGTFTDRWRWETDVHPAWVDSIKDDWPAVWTVIESARTAYGPDMAAFLCWLGVRLMEMYRILREDGSIYVHCDQTANHYLKTLMDAIFGAENFRSEITWKRTSAHSDTRQGRQQYGRIQDHLLFYTRSSQWTWNPVYTPYDADYVASAYKYTENETGRKYRLSDITGPGGAAKGNPRYEVMGVTRYWRYSQERMQELIDEGRIVQRNPGGVPSYKRYLDEMPGVPLQDLWTDINPLQSSSKERTGYPTQKPLALYERIIKSSSNPGDIVLDPFCGCATTPIAAERLGRQWVGMDIWEGAYDQVQRRIEDNRQLLADPDPQITYTTIPPVRTDDGDEPKTPALALKAHRFKAKWETLSHAEMRDILAEAQAHNGEVACAGCGITLPLRFMELDHQIPRKDRGANTINNRILLCGPCNGAKRENLTLSGLMARNKKAGEMTSDTVARVAADKARNKAEECQITMS